MASSNLPLQVCTAVKHTHCVFNFDDEDGKTKTISGVTWKVPAGVGVTSDTSEASSQFCRYTSCNTPSSAHT